MKYYVMLFAGKPISLFRVEGQKVERYEGSKKWARPPAPGEILACISGLSSNWCYLEEVTLEGAEEAGVRAGDVIHCPTPFVPAQIGGLEICLAG